MDSEVVRQAFVEHRPYLAFRMLGDIGAAEDVVQDAFSRLRRSRLVKTASVSMSAGPNIAW